MHATSLCLAIHRTKRTICVLCVGTRMQYSNLDGNLPLIAAWGECESDEAKELRRKTCDRAERRSAMRAGSATR